MNRYEVTFDQTTITTFTVFVDAETEDEAREKFNKGEYEEDPEIQDEYELKGITDVEHIKKLNS